MDDWLESHNAERTHSGKYCYGKPPLQTFIEGATIALEKQLDQLQPIEVAGQSVSLMCPSS